jgi:hypothetical protein
MEKQYNNYRNIIPLYVDKNNNVSSIKDDTTVREIPIDTFWYSYAGLCCFNDDDTAYRYTGDTTNVFIGIPQFEVVKLTIRQMLELNIPIEPLNYLPFEEYDLNAPNNCELNLYDKEKLKALSCKKIWYSVHPSDEVSVFMLIFLNDLLVAAYSKEGDRNGDNVYFYNNGKNLLIDHFLVGKKGNEDDSLEQEFVCFGNYSRFTFERNGKYYYSIADTDSMDGFYDPNQIFHYFIDDNLDNEPIRVKLVKKLSKTRRAITYLVKSIDTNEELEVFTHKLLYCIS